MWVVVRASQCNMTALKAVQIYLWSKTASVHLRERPRRRTTKLLFPGSVSVGLVNDRVLFMNQEKGRNYQEIWHLLQILSVTAINQTWPKTYLRDVSELAQLELIETVDIFQCLLLRDFN